MYVELAHDMEKADLLRLMEIASRTENDLRFASTPSIKFETALVQMASMDKAKEIKQLLQEIKKLSSMEIQDSIEEKKNNKPIVEEVSQSYDTVSEPKEVNVIDNESIESKWQRFISSEATATSDYPMIREAKDYTIEGHEIQINIKESFIYDNLISLKSRIQSDFKDMVGSSLQIILNRKEKEEVVKEERPKHPIERKIIEDFKAFEEKSED